MLVFCFDDINKIRYLYGFFYRKNISSTLSYIYRQSSSLEHMIKQNIEVITSDLCSICMTFKLQI